MIPILWTIDVNCFLLNGSLGNINQEDFLVLIDWRYRSVSSFGVCEKS